MLRRGVCIKKGVYIKKLVCYEQKRGRCMIEQKIQGGGILSSSSEGGHQRHSVVAIVPPPSPLLATAKSSPAAPVSPSLPLP